MSFRLRGGVVKVVCGEFWGLLLDFFFGGIKGFFFKECRYLIVYGLVFFMEFF